MKRFGIIVLSAFVLYAGVAWALDECFAVEHHPHHLASEIGHDLESSSAASHAAEICFPLIHCPYLTEPLGGTVITATAMVLRPFEARWFISFDSIPPMSSGYFGPDFPSEILTVSFYARIPRHLYFSVLHI